MEALDEPFAAFPSWFMRITCDRYGKDRMVNEGHMAQRDLSIRTVLNRAATTGAAAGQGGWNC